MEVCAFENGNHVRIRADGIFAVAGGGYWPPVQQGISSATYVSVLLYFLDCWGVWCEWVYLGEAAWLHVWFK